VSSKIIPVILAGGSGTRLWPLSRASAPKQFIRVMNEETLFHATLKRVADQTVYEAPVVVTREEFRFLVAEQAREAGIALSAILLEPVGRNTAPAIAASAIHLAERYGDDAVMQVLPADHEIETGENYSEAIRLAVAAAADGMLVTFGIAPTEPATGYGYIELGDELVCGVNAVKRFVEKPSLPEALSMTAEKAFVWNSGMFMFKTGSIIGEFKRHAPEVEKAAREAVAQATRDLDFLRLNAGSFESSPNISIDYAVMEKTSNAAVVKASFVWSDLGAWDAVWKLGTGDPNGNVTVGNITLLGTNNSLVLSSTSHLAVQGMDGVAVIASEDAVYVGKLEESQNVSALVKHLAAVPRTAPLTQNHPTSYRPWGGYTSILNGDRFQVKRLFVTPGKKLSLQKHHHRSEHWICVKGTAEVTIGDEIMIIRENESVYIRQGEVHRLANPGKITLEMIEVQTGSYLGEDDIIRIVDEFGRN
jgi:mannose-1-phosphate guanylyltransferase